MGFVRGAVFLLVAMIVICGGSVLAAQAGGGSIATNAQGKTSAKVATSNCHNEDGDPNPPTDEDTYEEDEKPVIIICDPCAEYAYGTYRIPPVQNHELKTCQTSVVSNLSYTHYHFGYDYKKCATPSCVSCGAGTPGGELLRADLFRVICARDAVHMSSFGPAVSTIYDIKLSFYQEHTGAVVDVFDPLVFGFNRFKDGDADGVFTDSRKNTAKGITLYDGNGYEAGNRISTAQPGGEAVLKLHNGRQFFFDIIDLSGGSTGTLNNGLQLHLPLNETEGAAAQDVSGNGRDGAVAGTAVWGTGKVGGALQFDGVDDQVVVTGWKGISGGSSRTISAWIKTSSTADQAIVAWGKNDTNKKWIFRVQDDNGIVGALRCEVNGGHIVGHVNVADGQWHHVAVTLQESEGGVRVNEAKMYVDGALQRTSSSASAPVQTADAAGGGVDVMIGNDQQGRRFTGQIDEVRIYDRVLSEDELRAMLDDTEDRVLAGRLTRIQQLSKYGISVGYKTWTAAQLVESPSRQWQINEVKDDQNRTLQFNYRAEQVAGRWAVESIVLPDGVNQLQYTYNAPDASAMFLSKVTYPDGTESAFDRTYDADSKCTKFHISDLAAEPSHRFKDVYVTNNVSQHEYAGSVAPQSSGMVRLVTNGSGEVTYMSIIDPVYTRAFIYEGGGKMKHVYCAWESKYATSWSFKDPNNIKYSTINFTGEPKFEYTHFSSSNNYSSWFRAEPSYRKDNTGRKIDYMYNSAGSVTQAKYSDGTTKKYQYNEFQQVTRYKDRLNRVKKHAYDSRGNMTLKEVGIKEVGGVDVKQPEYAAYKWTYYPDGHVNEGLLQYAYDAVSDPDTETGNRTDYIYNANNLLEKIIEPADVAGGERPERVFTYDSAGRLTTSTDAEQRTTQFFHDGNGRLEKTLYSDNSTERYIFGDAASAHPGFMLKKKDRIGSVTSLAYDASGRKVETKLGEEVMDLDDNVSPSGTEPEIRSYTYVNGTELVDNQTINGERTVFGYDYRHRLTSTTTYPREGVTLTSKAVFRDNLLFNTEDAYGRKNYHCYRGSDAALVKRIQSTVPEFALADYAAIDALSRDAAPNAQFLITTYQLDAEAQVVGTIDPRGIKHAKTFDSRGRPVQSVGATATVAADGTETTITDMKVKAITETDYDVNSNVVEIRNPRHFDPADNTYQSNRTTMTYNNRNLLASRTVAKGTLDEATEYFTYYLDRLSKTHTDFRQNDWTKYWHKCCGYLMGERDPEGHGRFYNYDPSQNRTHEIVVRDFDDHDMGPPCPAHNPLNANTLNETTIRYDARHRPIATTRWLVPISDFQKGDNVPIAGGGQSGDPDVEVDGVVQGLSTFNYYLDNLTDPAVQSNTVMLSNGTAVNLDTLIAELEADGVDVIFDEGNGSARVVENPEHEVSVVILDGVGRQVAQGVIDPADSSVITFSTMAYDQTVNATGFSDGAGGGITGTVLQTSIVLPIKDFSTSTSDLKVVSRTDGAGRAIEVVDQEGNISTLAWDANSNRKSIRDPNGLGKDCVYDARNREISCTDTQGDTTGYTFDCASNVIGTTDAKTHDTTCTFDARNRKVRCLKRVQSQIDLVYDDNNNLLEIKDGDANAKGESQPSVVYRYDGRNLRILEAFRDDASEDYYSTDDTDLSIFDADDRVVYTHDGAMRLATRTDQVSDLTTFLYDMGDRLLEKQYPSMQNDVFTYDLASRLLSAECQRYGNVCGRSYDKAGRLETESLTVDGRTYTIQNGFDIANRKETVMYPDLRIMQRTFTDRNQLHEVKFGGTVVANGFVYDAGMRETNRVYANGVAKSMTFDRNDNLATEFHYQKDAVSLVRLSYDYDANKNKRYEQDHVLGFTDDFEPYDADDRLVSWSRTGTDTRTQTWNLTKEGDWDDTMKDGVLDDRSHNSVHEVTSGGMAHDIKGNLTLNKNGQVFAWDYENLLTHATVPGDPDQTHVYEYDAFRRRVKKNLDDGSSVVYAYSGWQVVAEYEDGALPISPTRTFVFGAYIDEPLMMEHWGTRYYYHQNALYSVAALTDDTGSVVERYEYEPYGKVTVLDAAGDPKADSDYSELGNPFTFTGRRLDQETGLMYYRNRYYETRLGRFVSRDPLISLAWYLDSRNIPQEYEVGQLFVTPYQYASGKPISMVDQYGLDDTSPRPRPTPRQAGGACQALCIGAYGLAMTACAFTVVTGPGLAACAAAASLGFAACMSQCPMGAKDYCEVRIVSSDCKRATDLAPGTEWCVRCPLAEDPGSETGYSENRCCPVGKSESWRMYDTPPLQLRYPKPGTASCKVTFKYISQSCTYCPETNGKIYPLNPKPHPYDSLPGR